MIEAQTSLEKSAKVFFAIWPDTFARKKISQLAGQLAAASGGKPTRSVMTHLTLVFIGNVACQRLKTLREVANEVRQFSFDLTIDDIQYWPHNRIIHAGPRHCPAELLALVADLQSRLTQAGFLLEKRPYVPHVTLVRKAMCSALPDLTTSITWHVKKWSLVESRQTNHGSEYVSLDHWSLQ